MTVGAGGGDVVCSVDDATAAANAVEVIVMDVLVGVPKEICEIYYGGSTQGY